MSQKVVYLCDAGEAAHPCAKETKGFYIKTGYTNEQRHDLCEYHMHVIFSALRGQLHLPRDAAEAACP